MPESDALAALREQGIDGSSDRLAYFEWSTDDDADADDVDSWYEANPALGYRISEEYIQDELDSFKDIPDGMEKFKRERLGIWARLGGESVFPDGAWGNLADPDSTTGDRTVLVVEVAGNRESASVVAVSIRADGKFHVEVVENREGTSWVSHRLRELRANGDIEAIYSIAGSHVESMLPEFKRDGVRVKLVRFAQYVKWCGLMFSKIVDGEVRHLDDPILNDAVEGVQQKWTQDKAGFYWSRKDSTVDITPLVGVTVGVGVLEKKKSRPVGEKRKAVIL